MRRLILILLIMSGVQSAQGHIVGTQSWCLVFSPFHQECTFDIESECYKNLKREATLSTSGDSRPIPKGFEKFCAPNDLSKPKSFFDKPY